MRSPRLPAGAFLLVGALYLATLARVHRGDAPGFLFETRAGMAHDPAHLLARPLLALVLACTDRLLPGVQPLAVLAAFAALGGATAAALATRWLLDREVAPGLALASATGASVAYGVWSTSVTYEDHAWPLALALAVGEGRGRALLAGALGGLAVALHVLAAPVLGVLAFALRRRPGSAALALLAALAVLQAGHLLTFLLPDPGGGPPTHLAWPVALLQQAGQLGGTEAVVALPWTARPLAVAQGLGRGLLAPGAQALPDALWALVPLVVLGVGVFLGRPGQGVSRAWLLLALPLAAWVGPQNWEYYRVPWLATWWLGALLAPRRRWATALAWALVVALAAANLPVVVRVGRPAAVEQQLRPPPGGRAAPGRPH